MRMTLKQVLKDKGWFSGPFFIDGLSDNERRYMAYAAFLANKIWPIKYKELKDILYVDVSKVCIRQSLPKKKKPIVGFQF